MDEIHALKDALFKEEGRVRGLVDQVNKLSSRAEDLSDENTKLRKKAGLGETDKVDIQDVRHHKAAQITQLRSLNALLERQVGGCQGGREGETTLRVKRSCSTSLALSELVASPVILILSLTVCRPCAAPCAERLSALS